MPKFIYPEKYGNLEVYGSKWWLLFEELTGLMFTNGMFMENILIKEYAYKDNVITFDKDFTDSGKSYDVILVNGFYASLEFIESLQKTKSKRSLRDLMFWMWFF